MKTFTVKKLQNGKYAVFTNGGKSWYPETEGTKEFATQEKLINQLTEFQKQSKKAYESLGNIKGIVGDRWDGFKLLNNDGISRNSFTDYSDLTC